MNAREIAGVFETIAPLNSGIPDDELGFLWGDPNREVKRVGCVWDLNAFSIRACVRRRIDLAICHEALWRPTQESPWYEGPAAAEILPNRLRRELLERHGLVVYRSHSNWDALPGFGISDSAVASLGLKGLKRVARKKFFSVDELPRPMTVAALGARVAAGLGFSGCRLFGQTNRKIRRFAFLIGGFGENQHHMPQAAKALGAEAIIIGEMSEFIAIGCLEMGLPVIESLHSVSEIPGIKQQALLLAEKLAPIQVEYVRSGALAAVPPRGGRSRPRARRARR